MAMTIKDCPKEVKTAIKKSEDIMLDKEGVIYVVDNISRCVMIIKEIGAMTTINF